MSRRRWSTPFKAIRSPWISSDPLASKDTVRKVPKQKELGNPHYNSGNGHELVHWQKVLEIRMQVRIRVTAGHTRNAQQVHWEERAVECNESQREMPLANRFVHQSSEHLRKPEVDGREDAKQR